METVFPSVWKALAEGKVPNMDDLQGIESVMEYPWLMMCGQAMMDDMQDSRRAFANNLDLILDSLANQIAANQAAAEDSS